MKAQREGESSMNNIFMTIVNMSITATIAAFLILVFRSTIGRKLPKVLSYALWAIILLRLILPVSFTSTFSILDKVNPNIGQYGASLSQIYFAGDLEESIVTQQGLQEVQTGGSNGNAVGGWDHKENLLQGNSLMTVCAIIWLIGVIVLFTYSIVFYLKITRKVSTAVLLKDEALINHCKANVKVRWPFKIYVSDQIEGPFVCGILKPKIILPSFLLIKDNYDKEIQHILCHEMVHISRMDFMIKPLAFLTVIIHWFNPMMWICFHLANKDMEMSCDERVIRLSEADQRESYANTLLGISMKQNNIITDGFLAFGESNIGERVKNIVKYKNPKMWVIVVSILIIIAGGVSLLSNPIDAKETEEQKIVSVLFMGVRATNPGESTAVDSFILMGYEPSTGNLNIATVPRDTMVKDETREVKLGNYAALHKPDQVIQELNRTLGVNVSKYVKINTAAFRDFIDAIGGINYDVPQDMYYEDPMQDLHIELKKGPQVLDGKKAEMLVRFRHGYPEGDLTRIDVQKDFLASILTQINMSDVFKNIDSLYKIASINMETNLKKGEIIKYSATLKNHSMKKENIREINLPFSVTLYDGLYYVIIDKEKAQKLLQGKF